MKAMIKVSQYGTYTVRSSDEDGFYLLEQTNRIHKVVDTGREPSYAFLDVNNYSLRFL